MAIKVDLEPGKGDQELLGGKGNKKDLLKHLPANVARGLALMGIAVSSGACLAPSAKTPTAEPPLETAPVTESITPELNLQLIELSQGYPSDFAPYVDTLENLASGDGLQLSELGRINFIQAESNLDSVEYALVPMALVHNLTDPDGQPSNPLPVYYLAYRDQQGLMQGSYVLGKLIEQDPQGSVSYVTRILDEQTFRSWQNNTQLDGSVTLGQIVYAIPLREEISVEQAREIQANLNSGKLSSKDFMQNYALGVAFIQPGEEDQMVNVSFPSAPEESAKPFWKELFTGVAVAHAAGLELSATATVPELTSTTEPTPTPTPTPTLTPTLEPTPTTEPTPTPTSTPEPTPTAKPTLTPEQKLAEFKESAEYKQGLQDYLNAMGLKEENVAITEEVKVINGEEYRFLVATPDQTKLTPEQQEYIDVYETVPLFIWGQNKQGKWDWQEATLKGLGEIKGILIGSFYGGNNTTSLDFEKIAETIKKEFSLAGIWVGMSTTQPEEDIFDLNVRIALMNRAKQDHLSVLIHPLVWWDDAPNWIRSQTGDQLLASINNHVGRIALEVEKNSGAKTQPIIIVVNEANNPRDFYYKRLGFSYVETAFRAARNKAPSALLIYNDYNNHTLNGERYQNTKDVVERLQPQGLIDGVGIQLIIDGDKPPSKEAVIEAIQSYGIPVYITEFSVNMRNISGSTQQRNAIQAKIYQAMTEACIESGVCKAFVDFQLGDKFSVWETTYNTPNADPTPYDDDINPKMALYTQRASLFK